MLCGTCSSSKSNNRQKTHASAMHRMRGATTQQERQSRAVAACMSHTLLAPLRTDAQPQMAICSAARQWHSGLCLRHTCRCTVPCHSSVCEPSSFAFWDHRRSHNSSGLLRPHIPGLGGAGGSREEAGTHLLLSWFCCVAVLVLGRMTPPKHILTIYRLVRMIPTCRELRG